MLTLGEQPYQGLQNEDVVDYICVKRKRLDPPQECPRFWLETQRHERKEQNIMKFLIRYELMIVCWQYQPSQRPTFVQIVENLSNATSANFKKVKFFVIEVGN